MASPADVDQRLGQLLDAMTDLVPAAGGYEEDLLDQSIIKLWRCKDNLSTSGQTLLTGRVDSVHNELFVQSLHLEIYTLCRKQRPRHPVVVDSLLIPRPRDQDAIFIPFAQEVLEGAIRLADILDPEKEINDSRNDLIAGSLNGNLERDERDVLGRFLKYTEGKERTRGLSNALLCASERGHDGTVKLLLKSFLEYAQEAQVHTLIMGVHMALYISARGRSRVVRLLLELLQKPFERYAKESERAKGEIVDGLCTALFISSHDGRQKIVKILLNRFLELARGKQRARGLSIAITIAAQQRHFETAKLLTDYSMDVENFHEILDAMNGKESDESLDDMISTNEDLAICGLRDALCISCSEDHRKKVIRFLLDRLIENTSSKQLIGPMWNALVASAAGGGNTVRVVLNDFLKYVDSECRIFALQNALKRAAESHNKKFPLLLKQFLKDAKKTKKDPKNDLSDVLDTSSEGGHTDMVKALLKHLLDGVEKKKWPKLLSRALIKSSAKGHYDIVKELLRLLLDGVEKKKWPKLLSRALIKSSAKGHYDIVKLLLESFLPHAKGRSMVRRLRAALCAASKKGRIETVQMLLDAFLQKAEGQEKVLGLYKALKKASANAYLVLVNRVADFISAAALKDIQSTRLLRSEGW